MLFSLNRIGISPLCGIIHNSQLIIKKSIFFVDLVFFYNFATILITNTDLYMKRLVSCLILLMATVVGFAQQWESRTAFRSVRATAPSKVRKVTIEPTNDQMWWGYFNEDDANSSNFQGVGVNNKDDYEAAIFIPAGHEHAGGATIKAIRIWIGDYLSNVTGLKVWIAKSLTNDASGADYVQEVSLSSLSKGANDISLNTPFAVNNQGIYVGYTMKLNAQAYAVMCGGEWEENSFFIRSSNVVPDWGPIDYMGKLALQVLLDGVRLHDFSAVPSDFGTVYAEKDGTATVPVKITNTGKYPITSVTFTIATDGQISGEYTAPMNNLAFNASDYINVSLDAGAEARKYEKTLTITKVCGMKNEAETNSASGALVTVSGKPTVVPVVEEFTGTWCGWCPIGFVGMEQTQKNFGDKVVLIAVHSGDVMEIEEYAPILNLASSYPSSLINRVVDVYPMENYLAEEINQCMASPTVGKIEAEAVWTDENMTAISINTSTKFVYSDDNGQYGIAFVLVEDGLKGSDSRWAQNNFLSGNSNYSDYDFWYNSPSQVTDFEFDHVAVAAWGIENGIDGSVSPAFKDGQILKYSYNADISTKSLIQDKSKLKLVALLIDRTNGQIVNAAQTTIGESKPYSRFDVNRDRKVDISDIVAVINVIAGDDTFRKTANVNEDVAFTMSGIIGVVDISDVVAIINYMAAPEGLNDPEPPEPPLPPDPIPDEPMPDE